MSNRRLMILGSGPAGFTAAVYAARANLSPLVVSGPQPGGQLSTTTDVDNWPGEKLGLQGPDLMERMRTHAERAGATIIGDTVQEVELGARPFVAKGRSDAYEGDACVIATGATAKYLGLDSEQRYLGSGVSACATCDGFFYKDEDVVVVGGGNTAAEEALYLANIARHVTIVHRRDRLRAEAVLQEHLFSLEQRGSLSFEWTHEVEEVLGDGMGVNGLRLVHSDTGAHKEIPTAGMFLGIGHIPNTHLFEGQIELEGGYITVESGLRGNATATSVPGVFAAGDVADHVYRQAVTSAGTGCMAALDAERYLQGL